MSKQSDNDVITPNCDPILFFSFIADVDVEAGWKQNIICKSIGCFLYFRYTGFTGAYVKHRYKLINTTKSNSLMFGYFNMFSEKWYLKTSFATVVHVRKKVLP